MNTGFSKYLYSGTGNIYPTTLDITNYFDSLTGVCTYTQCSIVDDSGNAIPWLKDATLSGNICSFNVDTSAL